MQDTKLMANELMRKAVNYTISDIPTNAINTYEIALIITVTDDIIIPT